MAETRAELNKRMKAGYLKRKQARSSARAGKGSKSSDKAAKIKKEMAEAGIRSFKPKKPVTGILERQGY